jgi:hypothetical protein
VAQELEIRGTRSPVKRRSPWAAALLPFATLGIYHLVWWYRVNRELRDYGQAKGVDLGQSPTNSLLALFPGCFLLVPPLVSYWRGFRRVQAASETAGVEPVNGWLGLVFYFLLAPALWAYQQWSLNEVWAREAEPAPAEPVV